MSVINKMLRDLDSRQAADTGPVQSREPHADMARGTRIVNDAERARQRRGSPSIAILAVVAVMVLGGAAGAWWFLNQGASPQARVEQVKGVPIAATAPSAIVATTGAVPAVAQKEVEQVIATSPGATAVEMTNGLPKSAAVAPPVTAKSAAFESRAPAAVSLKMDNTFKGVPRVDAAASPNAVGAPQPLPERALTERAPASPSAVPAAATVVPPSPPRQSPALEALAQAQSLWNSGSHDAAIDLLREALTVAERANLAGSSSGNNSVLASLARELARMELAQGQVSQALAMLTRLEPALSGFADVWAVRGNAAQRLGRHQESAAAYLMALKLRPDEPRWMLGAAVSLAAQGQTAAAAELAEKARAGGVLSREVAAYLRQLGVPLRER
ncbi:MAG: hypothetical protein Q7T10_02280 [Rhodoferax sp.]|uniref:tetratricopeptide repeat protein n=1 Tax=Rhodoferax sp. TaxID=50421 RepID=UPI0027159F50|nr:tetratricopeptide repeat protein [Rhodoferax sp.]MDO8447617.1 hypothetical protein [Rhodoferax sp.]